MRAALERHDAIVTAAVGAAGGTIFKHTGDGMLASLPSAATATEGSIEELSDRLHPASWAAADPAGRVNQYRLMLDRLAK